MKRIFPILALIVFSTIHAFAGGNRNAIQEYLNQHYPHAKHIQMHETAEGITMVLFIENEKEYKVGFDLNNRPCCSEVEITPDQLPNNVLDQLPNHTHIDFAAYDINHNKHYYVVEYKSNNTEVVRFFDQNGQELHR